jgi:hypothetical protein
MNQNYPTLQGFSGYEISPKYMQALLVFPCFIDPPSDLTQVGLSERKTANRGGQ